MATNKSKIDYKYVDVDTLLLPQVSNINTPQQSELPIFGRVCFDINNLKICVGDGATWQEANGNIFGPNSSTNNSIALFNGTTGKILKSSGINIVGTDLSGITTINGNNIGNVVGPISSIDNTLVVYDSTTGKLLKNGSTITAIGGALASVDSLSLSATSSNTVGVVNVGGSTFMHNYSSGTYVGPNAGNFTMTGLNNTAIGTSSLLANTTGTRNTAVGYNASRSNTTGPNNTAIGYQALYTNSTGQYNVAIGDQALYNTSAPLANVAIGYQALYSNNNYSNTAIGHATMANATGYSNTAIGQSAMGSAGAAYECVAIGYEAMNQNSASKTIGIGYRSLRVNSGASNTAIGDQCCYNMTTGNFNTAIGSGSQWSVTTGTNNTTMGVNTMFYGGTGSNNTAIGSGCMFQPGAGNNNTAVGLGSLQGMNGSNNTAMGYQTGNALITGGSNTFVGYRAGYNYTSSESNNVCISNQGVIADSGVIRIGTAGTQTSCYVSGIYGVTDSTAVAVAITSGGQLVRKVNNCLPTGELYYGGDIGVGTSTTINITPTTTFVLLNPVTILNSNNADFTSNQFDSPSNGILRYVGTKTVMYHVSYNICYSNSVNNQRLQFAIYKNGIIVSGSCFAQTTSTSTNIDSIAGHKVVSIAPNDTISVYIQNLSGTSTITIYTHNLLVMSCCQG
jgi:hypothetical protein